ncbi:MAG: hypothetical protein DMG71_09285 [Acidobacteria bacterium]|nr:MAG: hypothetical protein DMG71_09285 [Acidobacteriota bacterium]
MSCPLCGDLCRCDPEPRPMETRPRFLPRFEGDSEAGGTLPADAVLEEPEADDCSEQQCTVRLDAAPAGVRFTVDGIAKATESEANAATPAEARADDSGAPEVVNQNAHSQLIEQPNQLGESLRDQSFQDPALWRQELAARVHRYRSRTRSRGPRYPSLRLKFEPAEGATSPRPAGRSGQAQSAPARAAFTTAVAENVSGMAVPSLAVTAIEPAAQPHTEAPLDTRSRERAFRDATAKIIEFPRCSAMPARGDELAEPILDRPRILEVPEMAPAPPALGGILLDAVEVDEPEKRPGIDVPLQSAPLEQRLFASALDGALVLSATALFGYIFFKIAAVKPGPPLWLGMGAAVSAFLWAVYHYILLVYTGSTPGLKAAKLQLSRFDGSPVSRRLRRWRVLVSVLSAISFGMGYAWCLVDEDALCWHDRITRTYLAPKTDNESSLE